MYLKNWKNGWQKRTGLISACVLMLCLAVSLVGARKFTFSPHEKAAFLSDAQVALIRPGLNVKIASGSIAADGTITVVFTATDSAGAGLDPTGVLTPGPLSLRYVAAYIPKTGTQYVAYTTSTATGTRGTVIQAGQDTAGVTTTLDANAGKYQYVYSVKAPAGFDNSATTSLAVFASRDMSAFNLPTAYATDIYTFVPNGAKVTQVRDVVRTASCDRCHDQLSFHGGRRRGVEACILCHTPQTQDANSATTSVDMKVFIHKIHSGSSLPSVVAGGKYTIGSSDFSNVAYPTDTRRCESCHDQTVGATQAKNYLTRPSIAACGSCHDDVNFATGKNHAGGAYTDDTLCATCHAPQGQIDFDASIKGAHTIPTESSLLGGIQATITKITNNNAGQKPTVTFTLLDGSGAPLPLKTLGSLSLTIAGPTTEYGTTNFGSDVTTPGYVTESAQTASVCGQDGTCTYAFTHAIPAGAKGTFVVGSEARRTETILAGTSKQQSVQYGAKNSVLYFSVDGSAVAPRRTVVQTSNCNNCHFGLSVHGALRNQTEYCVICHNPQNTDISVRPSATVAADKALPPQGINFNLMVHRIHTGANLAALGSSYVVVGYGGSHNDFSGVLYPAMSPTGSAGDTRNCERCHVNNSEQNLPVGRPVVLNPQGPVSPVPATTAACIGCHADTSTAVHASANTTTLGESCNVCHKAGAAYSVASEHAQY